MDLQIALDFDFDYERVGRVLPPLVDNIQIIEAGTPFLMEEGLGLLQKLKADFPSKKIVADLKIADAGYREAENAFKQGADIVTCLAVVDDATIINVRDAAREYGKEVLVDMIGAQDLKARIQEIDAMGVDYICLHTSKDLQKLNPDVSAAFATLRGLIQNAKLVIAGGINAESIASYAAIQPDVIIVGEGITLAEDPAAVTAKIRAEMDRY